MTIIEQIKADIERKKRLLSTLESEKPIHQERLDENIKHYIEDCGWGKDSTIPVGFVRQIASHFYDLGCRRTAEKYDEIEYNRQRAEEQGSDGLEEEISKKYANDTTTMRTREQYAELARHFAKWGAEQAREQMMKEAVDVHIAESFNPVSDNIDTFLHGFSCTYEVKESTPYMIAGEHVKIIFVKED